VNAVILPCTVMGFDRRRRGRRRKAGGGGEEKRGRLRCRRRR
jgi:hypothetical protein